MNTIDHFKRELGDQWLSSIYAEKVRTIRTRAYELAVPERENRAEIMHTLLGIELKVGRRRFSCPDLATARYIRVFARLGCQQFAIPYDITKISSIADELEISWQRLLLLAATASSRLRGQLVRGIRSEISVLGPGEKIPHFRQSTKQRGA